MMNPMRILVLLVLNWKFLEIISRWCATLSAIGCTISMSWIDTRCVLQWVAVCCSVLQWVAVCCSFHYVRSLWADVCTITMSWCELMSVTLHHTATHSNTLQHTTTHCNTLQHTATHCNTLQHTISMSWCTYDHYDLMWADVYTITMSWCVCTITTMQHTATNTITRLICMYDHYDTTHCNKELMCIYDHYDATHCNKELMYVRSLFYTTLQQIRSLCSCIYDRYELICMYDHYDATHCNKDLICMYDHYNATHCNKYGHYAHVYTITMSWRVCTLSMRWIFVRSLWAEFRGAPKEILLAPKEILANFKGRVEKWLIPNPLIPLWHPTIYDHYERNFEREFVPHGLKANAIKSLYRPWYIKILEFSCVVIVCGQLGSKLAFWEFVPGGLKATATGWRRPIGCFKLQVIFRKRATNYRALLWEIEIRHPHRAEILEISWIEIVYSVLSYMLIFWEFLSKARYCPHQVEILDIQLYNDCI